MRLLDPTGGRVVFQGRDITQLSRAEMRPIRREMMMIFQDPYASLNARKRVGFIVAEALEVHKLGTEAEIKRRVQELLEVVGLNPEHYNRFPHEFSGGQRQRIGVARALAVNPKLIVCDEPVSALDVSVQAQILNLLKDLQKEFGLTYVFVAHDLNVVRHISDRVMVMYLGKVMEIAERNDLYAQPEAPVHGRAALGDPGAEPRARPRSASTSCSRATSRTRSTRRRPATSTRAARASATVTATSTSRELRPFGGDGQLVEVPLPARALADERGGDAHAGPLQPRRRRTRLVTRCMLARGRAPLRPPARRHAPAARPRLALARRAPARRRRSSRVGLGRLYLVGCFLLVAGFFVGNRGPARLGAASRGRRRDRRACSASASGARRVRWATLEEREEAISNSAIFVALGLALILSGRPRRYAAVRAASDPPRNPRLAAARSA